MIFALGTPDVTNPPRSAITLPMHPSATYFYWFFRYPQPADEGVRAI